MLNGIIYVQSPPHPPRRQHRHPQPFTFEGPMMKYGIHGDLYETPRSIEILFHVIYGLIPILVDYVIRRSENKLICDNDDWIYALSLSLLLVYMDMLQLQ